MIGYDLFVPGRLCLFGEHSDWAGEYYKIDKSVSPGYCIAIGTEQGIYANIAPHPDKLIVHSKDINGNLIASQTINMKESELLDVAKSAGFFSYSAGVAYYLLKDYPIKGIVIDNFINLPIKRGLSSSASICVLTARAFSSVYNLNLSKQQEMEYAYKGEVLTGSKCGRMDQICAYGSVPIFLKFIGDDMEIEELEVKKPIYMLIADLNGGKNTRKILADLNYHFMNGNDKLRKSLRYALGEANKDILMRAKELIKNGDSCGIGELMNEAQYIFDKYVSPSCPEELSAPKLHYVLNSPVVKELVYGGKGVGSQGDGCAQFVVKGYEERKELINRLREFKLDILELTIKPQCSKVNNL